MAKSNTTNTLVLISKHIDPAIPYYDRWTGDILHYTGMGRTGDQSLINQNKTLAESDQNEDLGVFLFEVFEPYHYTYIGRVILAAKPYQETQNDVKGNPRLVWIFPLRLAGKVMPVYIPEEVMDKLEEKRESSASRLPPEEIQRRALESRAIPGERTVLSKRYERNASVILFSKIRAKGYFASLHASFYYRKILP